MEQKQKINLSAIMNSKNIPAENKKETNNKDGPPKQEIKKELDNKSSLENQNNTKDNLLLEQEEQKQEQTINNNKNKTIEWPPKSNSNVKITKDSIIKKEEKAEETEKKREEVEKTQKVEETSKQDKSITNTKDNKEIFSNYKTDYKQEKISILQQIKKLKNIPKTNYKFVLWSILITVLWIWLLFYFDPEDHSIQNYKASIFNMIYEDEIAQKRQEIEDEYNQLLEDLKWKIEYVKYSWFNFTVEYRTINWVKTYKYNNIEYESKQELDKVLAQEVEYIKKWIIKDVLINSFK